VVVILQLIAGDADFRTKDTLWDFKVSKNEPTKDHTLQLIVYYLLGMHSYECDFSDIKKIGIFNPRKNIVYEYEIENISKETIKEIEDDVIGYNVKINNNQNNYNKLTVTDIMKIMECSRHIVMKYYSEYNLPLKKEKNKYVIDENEFYDWLEEMERLKEEQDRNIIIIIGVFIIITLLMFLLITNY